MARKRQRRGCPTPVGKVGCGECGKIGYHSRKDAKRAAKNFPHEALREYLCPGDAGVWHFGHLPEEVRSGETTAAEFYGYGEFYGDEVVL